jgi:hypothetical protein
MMGRQYRKLDQLMMSLGDKEATYDAGPALWTTPAAHTLFEFGESFAGFEDKIVTDRDTVHGSIHATADAIVQQDVRFSYAAPRVRPTELAGFLALAGGVMAPLQDAALAAWQHKATPVAQDVELPSIGVQEKSSGEQFKYTGIMLDTLSLKRGGPQSAYIELAAGLIGSGTRATAADAFPAKIVENPFLWGKMQCWLESGADIAITPAATLEQGDTNISAGAADNFTTRLQNFDFSLANDLQADAGYTANSGLVRSSLHHGPNRKASVSLSLIVDPATLAAERAYYDSRANIAIELQCDMGVVIVPATGVFKFGFDLIIPRLRLNPIARSVDRGVNMLTLSGDAYDDGTNPIWIAYVYCAQAAFLA